MSGNDIKLKITGMKCGGCVSAVEDALKSINGVAAVTVSLEQNIAVVSGDVNVDQLIDAVEAAGFKAHR